jgi:hypothetical protein
MQHGLIKNAPSSAWNWIKENMVRHWFMVQREKYNTVKTAAAAEMNSANFSSELTDKT